MKFIFWFEKFNLVKFKKGLAITFQRDPKFEKEKEKKYEHV